MSKDTRGNVVSRHERYKAGQTQIVNWLANTAAQHCDIHTTLSCYRDAQSVDSPLHIKSHEYSVLAKIITAVKGATVPAGIFKLLEDVIDGRQTSAVKFASKTTKEDFKMAEKNESHISFIDILLEVHEQLLKLPVTSGTEIELETVKGKKKKKVENKDSSDELRNLFQYLLVEEPSTSALGDTGPTGSSKAATQPTYKLEHDQEMDSFALWCHLKDMSDTRLFVKSLWQGYRQGDFTLELAGVVTEVAIAMMRRAHVAFAKMYPKFDHWRDIMKYLQLQARVSNGVVCMFPTDNALTADHFSPDKRPFDLLCPSAAATLKAFAESSVDYFAERLNHLVPSPRLHSDRTTFGKRLLSMVPELCLLKEPKREKQVHDAFIAGLLQLMTGDDGEGQPVSTVFACQLCMDIDEIFGSEPSPAGDALVQASTNILASTDRIPKFCSAQQEYRQFSTEYSAQVSGLRAHAIRCRDTINHYRVLQQEISKSQADVEHEVKYEDSRNSLVAKLNGPGINELPHCAGAASYHLRLQFHSTSIAMANENSVVILLAHFYKAARAYGLVTVDWHDINFVTSQNDGKKPLITKTHSKAPDPYAMLRHYLLDIGMDASTVSNKGAPPPCPTSLKNAKELSGSASVLLSATTARFEEGEKLGIEKDPDVVLAAVLSIITAKSDQGGKTSRTQHFSPIQLLETYKSLIIDDEPRHNIDYFEFAEMCLVLLKEVITAGSLPENAKNKNMFESVYWLMKLAGNAVRDGKSVADTAFGKAAKVMQQKLEAMNTKKTSQAAFNASSGRIPKALRPRLRDDKNSAWKSREFLEKYPGISVGTSREQVELFDPRGSDKKFESMLDDEEVQQFMPEGSSSAVIRL